MKKLLMILMGLIISANISFADSPLTSTDFYRAYLDVPIVKKAADKPGKLTEEMMDFLYNDNNPLDQRIALINAVGWNFDGLSTFDDYIDYCSKYYIESAEGDTIVYRIPVEEIVIIDPDADDSSQFVYETPQRIGDNEEEVTVVEDVMEEWNPAEIVIANATNEQMAVLVYLKAMSNYFDTENNYYFFERAMQTPLLNRQSYMLPMVLVLDQTAFDLDDWGNIYPATRYYLDSPEIKDVRPEAIKIVMDYIELYKEDAEEK